MRILKLICVFLCLSLSLKAQMTNPIKWNFSQKQLNDSISELKFTAILESGWHLYSQFTPDGGPLPTVFDFTLPKEVLRIGKVKEPAYDKKFEVAFGVDVYTFPASKVVFTQRVQNNSAVAQVVSGEINGMTCKDEVGCIPMDATPFKFTLPAFLKTNTQKTVVDTGEVLVAADTAAQTKPQPKDGSCRDYTIEGLITEKQ